MYYCRNLKHPETQKERKTNTYRRSWWRQWDNRKSCGETNFVHIFISNRNQRCLRINFLRGSATFDSVSVCFFFLFSTGSHVTKEDGMGWEKFSYAKWGTNEFKSGKYSDRSSQRLEISIFLINKESFFLLTLNTSTTVTKVKTHNDCIVRLWHILWHISQRKEFNALILVLRHFKFCLQHFV